MFNVNLADEVIKNAEKSKRTTKQTMRKKAPKSKPSNSAIGTADDIKLGQELSSSILKELDNLTNTLTSSYGGAGSLPLNFVWPNEEEEELAARSPRPTGRIGHNPPSEYDASYVEFPVQAKQKPYAPVPDSSPIPVQTTENSENWKSVNHVEYIDFSHVDVGNNEEPMAGMPPDEDIGKSAPTYFAWSENEEPTIVVPMKPSSKAPKAAPLVDYPMSPSPQKSVATASTVGDDSMAAAITETQESYGWNDVSGNHPALSHNDMDYDPNFLVADVDDGPDNWKTETQFVNEALERAKNEGGLDPTRQYVCGTKQSSNEVYPLGFAWSRSSPADLEDSVLGEKLIIPSSEDSNDIHVSSENKKQKTPMLTEYNSSYTAKTAPESKKIAQKETRLQMGLSPEFMDASKWRSEYDTACDGYKASLYKKVETPKQLKKRKPLKRPKGGRRGATLRPREPEVVVVDGEEVDGFVVVDLEESTSHEKTSAAEKAQQKKAAAAAAANSVKASELRRQNNNVFQYEEIDSSLFKSEYEVQYAWPETGKECVTLDEEKITKPVSDRKQSKIIEELHPPYALDEDVPPPIKPSRKNYTLSLEKPLNLFREMEDEEDEGEINPTPLDVVITPPYACAGSLADESINSEVGKHKVYKGRGPQPPNVPDSEYHDAFKWTPGAEKLMEMNPNGIANRKKNILTTSEKNIQFTVGGTECEWENEIDIALQKRRAVPVTSDVENEDIGMDITNTMVAAINAGKIKSTGNIGKSKAPPVKITKTKPTKGTRKVDNALIEANEAGKARRANAVMKSAARKAERDNQYSNRNVQVNADKENFSVASDLSDLSPVIKHTNKPPLPFRPSGGKASKRVQKITPEKHGNPILRNKRYPSLSDAQSSRWKSEAKLQFINRGNKM